jgi:thioredoxin 1
VEGVAGEFAGKAKFVKVNIADAEDVAASYGIFAVPTLLFFRDGQLVDKSEGLIPKAALKTRVEELLAG